MRSDGCSKIVPDRQAWILPRFSGPTRDDWASTLWNSVLPRVRVRCSTTVPIRRSAPPVAAAPGAVGGGRRLIRRPPSASRPLPRPVLHHLFDYPPTLLFLL